ncbi:hypothetical protein EI94DRAFT_1921832, partial [Lactarius quietus]
RPRNRVQHSPAVGFCFQVRLPRCRCHGRRHPLLDAFSSTPHARTDPTWTPVRDEGLTKSRDAQARPAHTSAQNAMSLPSQRRLRSCNCIIRFKILYICTWSWSSYRGGDLMTMQMKYDVFSEDVTRFYMHGQVYARH